MTCTRIRRPISQPNPRRRDRRDDEVAARAAHVHVRSTLPTAPAAGDRRRAEPIGGNGTDVRLTADSARPGASLPDADPEFAGDPLAAVRGIVHGVGMVVLIVGGATLPLWFDWFAAAVAGVLGMEVGR